MNVITIDTGTTNTRVCAWNGVSIVAEAFRPVGVRNTAITGSTAMLAGAVKEAIDEVQKKTDWRSSETLFLASGMITSNVGLNEVPHLLAPAGIEELAAGMVQARLTDVVDAPIWFIPGIKNTNAELSLENCEAMDIMRGEETESMGAVHALGIQGPAVIVLPGSHSKFVKLDAANKITGCLTSIAGEILDVVTKHTILASSVNHQFASEIDTTALLKGAEISRRVGFARTCFSVRILDLFTRMTVDQKASFLQGSVLGMDIQAMLHSEALKVTPQTSVVICGKKSLKDALHALVTQENYFKNQIIAMPDAEVSMAGLGALAIARQRGLLQ